MLAKLHSIVGSNVGKEVELSPENPLMIGRGEEADLTLAYGKVTPKNATIASPSNLCTVP